MVLQLLASAIYGTVESSWAFSTVFIKYFLLIAAIYSLQKREEFFERLNSFVMDYSREAVISIVLVGLISMIAGITYTPVLVNVSSFIALLYFGYLFWKF